jgi:SAM-dependent methyltransferase
MVGDVDSDDDALVAEQIAYYRAHAAGYDRVYAEREELRQLLTVVDDLPIAGDVLELACGTGQWTGPLAARARSVTAVDVAAEVLGIARARVASGNVRFIQADVFSWRPPRRYDIVFFAFWLSHVPPSRLSDFWATVAAALAPDGKAIFIDQGPEGEREEEVLESEPIPAVLRRVDDGGRYRVVKVFHDAGALTRDLAAQGWSADIRRKGGDFIGIARPPSAPCTDPG